MLGRALGVSPPSVNRNASGDGSSFTPGDVGAPPLPPPWVFDAKSTAAGAADLGVGGISSDTAFIRSIFGPMPRLSRSGFYPSPNAYEPAPTPASGSRGSSGKGDANKNVGGGPGDEVCANPTMLDLVAWPPVLVDRSANRLPPF
jgi:hypothetical protein